MKNLVILLVSLFAICYADEGIEIERPPTITDSLRAAQQDLLHGHVFAEEFKVQNRERLSNYLIIIEEQILASFMQGYADIKEVALETRRIMEEDYAEPSFCKDRVRNRWELQVTRYGQKLGQCLGVADGYIKQFTTVLNALHVESRVYSNVIPNSGVHVLAQTNVYDNHDDISQAINNRFRDMIFRALDRYTEFDEFVSEIAFDSSEVIRQLTGCFRSLPLGFVNESNQELESIRNCYSD